MRAAFHPDDIAGDLVTLTDEPFHHLKNVARVKSGENVLLLDGKGFKTFCEVESVEKRQMTLKVLERKKAPDAPGFELAICLPKKDFFEDAMRVAVQLGIRKIQPLSSSFSQWDFQESPRLEKVIQSSLIQSNNPYLPEILPQMDLNSYLVGLSSKLHYFSSIKVENSKEPVEYGEKYLLGPEAGFSSEEMKLLEKHELCLAHHLPTPIFTTVNAVGIGYGYLLGRV